MKSREVDELPLLAVSRAPPCVTAGAPLDAGGLPAGGPVVLDVAAPEEDEETVAGVAVLLADPVVGVRVELLAVVGLLATEEATEAEPVDAVAPAVPEVEAAELPAC